MYDMIIKIKNENPKVRFLTSKGWRSPKEVWIDTEYGHKDMTRKGVIAHRERLIRLGIEPDMTEEEAREHILKSKAN
ncbi:hypothetical protein [Siminovitchia sp. 179-K 8D1 HS]|uniref:hypothetical protein n=1 Tax=Siminovitchia sp. 179-K 8D1 HS TaxID=3142385 RepID=UPI0039A07D7B